MARGPKRSIASIYVYMDEREEDFDSIFFESSDMAAAVAVD